MYPPHEATGWGPAGRRPPPTPLRGAGIRCLEGIGDYSVNYTREVYPATLAVEAARGQTVGSVIPLMSRVPLNVLQPESNSAVPLEGGSSFPLRPGRSHEPLIPFAFPDARAAECSVPTIEPDKDRSYRALLPSRSVSYMYPSEVFFSGR